MCFPNSIHRKGKADVIRSEYIKKKIIPFRTPKLLLSFLIVSSFLSLLKIQEEVWKSILLWCFWSKNSVWVLDAPCFPTKVIKPLL